MSPAVVIVPVMTLIVVAAIALVVVLAYPYRGKSVPSSLPGAPAIDRGLEAFADQLGVGRHPDAERRVGINAEHRVGAGSDARESVSR